VNPSNQINNNSPFDRKAMVFLTYKNNEDFDESIREKEKEYRKNFALNYLKQEIKEKENKNLYSCGEESKIKI
jgi:hypothetical protein